MAKVVNLNEVRISEKAHLRALSRDPFTVKGYTLEEFGDLMRSFDLKYESLMKVLKQPGLSEESKLLVTSRAKNLLVTQRKVIEFFKDSI